MSNINNNWGTKISPCGTPFTNYAITCGTKIDPGMTLCYLIVLEKHTNLPLEVLQIIMFSEQSYDYLIVHINARGYSINSYVIRLINEVGVK